MEQDTRLPAITSSSCGRVVPLLVPLFPNLAVSSNGPAVSSGCHPLAVASLTCLPPKP